MTLYHLEPNLKEAPGGLRDCNVANWLALISAMDKLHDWPDASPLRPPVRKQLDAALDFLMSARCFLHFRHGRDDNTLSWEAQDEAAARKVGTTIFEAMPDEARSAKRRLAKRLTKRRWRSDVWRSQASCRTAWGRRFCGAFGADWMRIYFGHARAVQRTVTQLLEEIPEAWSALYRQVQSWRSRLTTPDFSVVDGLIFLQQPSALQDPEVLLRLFHFMAHSRPEAERDHRIPHRTSASGPRIHAAPGRGTLALSAGDAPAALRRRRAAGHAFPAAADFLLPELNLIDSLVVRDFYHRFTVDEHSFLAIESLHRLKQSQSEWDKRYGELLTELEDPELLYLALLLHDTGKGMPGGNHVEASLEVAGRAMDRLDVDPRERAEVLFLIESHLELSAALRRDIFNPETVAAFAEKMGTPERLKMLTLLTYADIKAVNPEALTPWKAENVWQLYMGCRELPEPQCRPARPRRVERRKAGASALARPGDQQQVQGISGRFSAEIFAGPFRRRSHAAHGMADELAIDPVQVELKRGRHWYELTLVTRIVHSLFAKLSGVLAAWGMNIVKANAFSNQAGTVVDTLYFTDRFRTLELNLSEWERFKRSVTSVLLGEADLEKMLRDRQRAEKGAIAKVKVETKIEFDDASSSTSTLRAGDRAGSSAAAASHRVLPVGSEMQHRNRVDRYRRADGD
jgi:[protein-PII] uridylyltransferase